MIKQIIKLSAFILFWTAVTGCANTSAQEVTQQDSSQVQDVNAVLEKLNKSTLELISFEGQIEWKYTQPALFGAQSLRKGLLYYAKQGEKTNLRLNFQTLKQDELDEQTYIEQWIVLDGDLISNPDRQLMGTWLVYIDYQTKELKYKQLAEPDDSNEPVDIFKLVDRYIPIVGFSRTEELKKQFEVSLIEQKTTEPEDFIQVHLDVKPNSIYKDNYKNIDFWIDRKIFLPVKIVAVTTEKDIYEIQILQPKINEGITEKIFDFTVPKGFNEPELFPLKEDTNDNI